MNTPNASRVSSLSEIEHAFVEVLEPRIAPATLINASTVTYMDFAGDEVTVKFSKPVLDDSNVNIVFTFNQGSVDGDNSKIQQLQKLNLNAAVFQGVGVSVLSPAGNGNVGHIFADGNDLGKVVIQGDLGRIIAGDDFPNTTGIKSLSVGSLGALGLTTGAPDLDSFVIGKIGHLDVGGNIVNASLKTLIGDIGKITIGGALVGGAEDNSGRIHVDGNVGKLSIAGGIWGSSGENSGSIYIAGDLGKFTTANIGNATTGDGSSTLVVDGKVGSILLSNSLSGGNGERSGSIEIGGNLGKISILGNMFGSGGERSGSLNVDGSIGKVQIGSPDNIFNIMHAGDGDFSASISSGDKIGKVIIYGGLSGQTGGGDFAASVMADGKIGRIEVTRSMNGGDGEYGASIVAGGAIGKITIGESVHGGDGDYSGGIFAMEKIGKVSIGQDLRANDGVLGGAIWSNSDIGKVSIKGMMVGQGDSAVNDVGAAIISNGKIGSVVVGDTVIQSTISAFEQIKSVKLGDDFRHSEILGGYFVPKDPVLWAPWNASATLGKISVEGNWWSSSAAAGVMPGPDGYGKGDSFMLGEQTSRIASIVIGGNVNIVPADPDSHFGFVAASIGSIRVAGEKLEIPAPGNSVPVGALANMTIHVM